jgi:hypothetical protein
MKLKLGKNASVYVTLAEYNLFNIIEYKQPVRYSELSESDAKLVDRLIAKSLVERKSIGGDIGYVIQAHVSR